MTNQAQYGNHTVTLSTVILSVVEGGVEGCVIEKVGKSRFGSSNRLFVALRIVKCCIVIVNLLTLRPNNLQKYTRVG